MKRTIRPLTAPDLGHFSIDDEHRLYWDNEIIHTPSVVKLSRFQSIVVILAAFATMLTSAAAWTTYLTYTRKLTHPQPTAVPAAPSPCTKQKTDNAG